jgi:hypothetical protein
VRREDLEVLAAISSLQARVKEESASSAKSGRCASGSAFLRSVRGPRHPHLRRIRCRAFRRFLPLRGSTQLFYFENLTSRRISLLKSIWRNSISGPFLRRSGAQWTRGAEERLGIFCRGWRPTPGWPALGCRGEGFPDFWWVVWVVVGVNCRAEGQNWFGRSGEEACEFQTTRPARWRR